MPWGPTASVSVKVEGLVLICGVRATCQRVVVNQRAVCTVTSAWVNGEANNGWGGRVPSMFFKIRPCGTSGTFHAGELSFCYSVWWTSRANSRGRMFPPSILFFDTTAQLNQIHCQLLHKNIIKIRVCTNLTIYLFAIQSDYSQVVPQKATNLPCLNITRVHSPITWLPTFQCQLKKIWRAGRSWIIIPPDPKHCL